MSVAAEGFVNPAELPALVVFAKFSMVVKFAIKAAETPEVKFVLRSVGNTQWILRFC